MSTQPKGLRTRLEAAQVTLLEELGKVEDHLAQLRFEMQAGLEQARISNDAVFDLVLPAALEPPVVDDIEVPPRQAMSTAESINKAMAQRAERNYVVPGPLEAVARAVGDPASASTTTSQPETTSPRPTAESSSAQQEMLDLVRCALVEIDVQLDANRKQMESMQGRFSSARTAAWVSGSFILGIAIALLLVWLR